MTDNIFEETLFIGDIIVGETRASVSFRASAGADGQLVIDLDEVSAETFLLAVGTVGQPGTIDDEFSLCGTSDDGKSVHSDRVFVVGHSSGSEGYQLSVRANIIRLKLPVEKYPSEPFLRVWFRAFKSFRNPTIETKLGLLEVWGSAKDVGPNDISGCIALQAYTSEPGENWRVESESFLQHMQNGLAFAHGGRLQTSRVDFIKDGVWEATFYAGEGSIQELSIQHPLHQRPFIEALVARYETMGPLPDVLWTAVGWMQVETKFDEVRFLTAMTALETIVEHQLPQTRGTIIPKAEYRILREKLKQVVREQESLSEENSKILESKINQINMKTLAQKIDSLFEYIELPKKDFEKNIILDLNKLRNNIVHSGIISEDKNIWGEIILVRELVARIIMRNIGFVGRYECYVGGHCMREFPPESNILTEPN